MSTESNAAYLLLFRGTNWHRDLSPEEIQTVMNQWKGWFDRLTEQGKAKAGQPLMHEGKIVSGRNGRVVADGPFAESKEAIGGYFLLQANSLDEAVAIAKDCPGLAYGVTVEVRPVAPECPLAERARQAATQEQFAHAGA
jgi:hypothetical protein